jgi:phosphatidylinositol kinase/protein kinase (PI-3  family)
MPCFEYADINQVLKKFEERFYEKKNDCELTKVVDDLIKASNNNFWTNKYDSYQKLTNVIAT